MALHHHYYLCTFSASFLIQHLGSPQNCLQIPSQELVQMFDIRYFTEPSSWKSLSSNSFYRQENKAQRGKTTRSGTESLLEELWPESQFSDGLSNDLSISLIENTTLKRASQKNPWHILTCSPHPWPNTICQHSPKKTRPTGCAYRKRVTIRNWPM